MSYSTTDRTEINRAEVNKANAQHSTGPKTPEGKQRSSLNALRHGLTGQLVVTPTEDLQAYQHHITSSTDEYHPEGATEAHLVQSLADSSWRLNRVAILEANLLTLAAARQPNPIDDAPGQVQDAMAIVAALESQSKTLANLSLHSQRLSRQFDKTVAQLRELQKIRLTNEKNDLDNLLDIMEVYESKGETYRPSDDGFVFSQPNQRQDPRPQPLSPCLGSSRVISVICFGGTAASRTRWQRRFPGRVCLRIARPSLLPAEG